MCRTAYGPAAAFQAPALPEPVPFSIMNFLTMASPRRPKEHERFYLLPGMGGRAYRRKQKFILKWSIIAGLLVSGVVAGLLYFLSRQ
jgi:hypothetical protein